ncbi:hypothetical protein [Acinetobacter populi]|jgi:hypothetical protein|uniref:Uncharacterized protein n=1 Tax=Acinetobacter populi TaxID=1582270 RepID=A0A1Z9Z166_9GAMM|nr:hypothetical protein [Acinetobacter populi]MCH4246213.1 hypothetical protein [Acinetobacter populi]OUY08213.1 hypothetical protein CAP51_00910 [Acinetobacter populi]
MPQYLRVAEKVYKKLEKNKGFIGETNADLNTLMIEIKNEIKGTELKLLYHRIDFDSLMMCGTQSKIKLDLSLIPKIKNSQEFILWLAGFIEKITTGGKRRLPPLVTENKLPEDVNKELSSAPSINHAEKIVEYFVNGKVS